MGAILPQSPILVREQPPFASPVAMRMDRHLLIIDV